jgi:hypothetical protein
VILLSRLDLQSDNRDTLTVAGALAYLQVTIMPTCLPGNRCTRGQDKLQLELPRSYANHTSVLTHVRATSLLHSHMLPIAPIWSALLAIAHDSTYQTSSNPI